MFLLLDSMKNDIHILILISFGIQWFLLVNINRNMCQKLWEHILKIFIIQAICALLEL